MSGTSLDGVDGVLGRSFRPNDLQVLAHAQRRRLHLTFRAELLALNTPADNELHRAALAGNALIAACYAEVVAAAAECTAAHKASAPKTFAPSAPMDKPCATNPSAARHADGAGYTLQLNNPALLAELTGIDVVADFRSRDVAAGGQGAPLVPAFHQRVFGQHGCHRGRAQHLGGIANLTVLARRPRRTVLGFDCGPGNALMDAWCQRHTGQAFDAAGAWAASGQLHARLADSACWMSPIFALPPPKSTGRDLVQPGLAGRQTDKLSDVSPPQDVQATLTELTASACIDCVNSYAKDSK